MKLPLQVLLLLSAVATARAETVALSTTTVAILPTADTVTEASMPLITEPPEIADLRKRQTTSRDYRSSIIGFFPWPDERDGPQWETATCASSSYFATGFDGRYGACCNPTTPSCVSVTSCGLGGTAYGPNSFWAGCPTSYECATITIFESKGSPTSYYYLGCSQPGDTTWVSKYYRHAFTFSTTSTKKITPTTATITATKTVTKNGGSNSASLPSAVEVILGLMAYIAGAFI